MNSNRTSDATNEIGADHVPEEGEIDNISGSEEEDEELINDEAEL